MCAPIPRGARLRRSSLLDKNPHSRVFSARRSLVIESRILPPIPQNIPQNMAPLGEASLALTDLPVTTPPITALSPDRSVSIPGLSANPGVQTFSIAPSVPTADVTRPTYVPTSSLAVVTLTSSLPSSKTIVSTIPGSTTVSSFTTSISTLTSISSTTSSLASTTLSLASTTLSLASTTSSLTSTTTSITPVTTITPVSQLSDSTVTTTSYTSIQSTETDTYSTESFTVAPSSTITDPSSSTVSSSTTNDTAPATSTAVVSPISVTPANLSAHNPSFYIGIVLGTVAVIACICALIAWFIRFRSHLRRRRAARSLKLPWAKSNDGDTWGLESGHGTESSNVDLAAISAMNLGSREDLANVQAWSPRGDRDVGEPRRAHIRDNGSTYSLQNHHIPEYCLFTDDSVRAFASSEGYSTASLLPHHNLRQLPSHLIDQELVARVSREHASLRSTNDDVDSPTSRANGDCCGTPRETMNKPRFLSLRGNGLNVPWHLNESSPRSMVERLRNHGKRLPAEPSWEQISPGQNLCETDKKDGEAEHWSTTLRTSLVNTFNAVAANLSPATGAPRMSGDGLTSAPSKRVPARKSVRDTFWDDNVLKAKELSRETSASTVTSNAWTLEETREGAGVVHLFIPGLQGCGDEPVIQRPHLSGPTLSFGDGDDLISDGHHDDERRREVAEHPQIPLIASEKPPPAVIRPDPSYTRRNTRQKTVDSSLSRAGSNYSMNFPLPPVASSSSSSSRPGSLRMPNPYDQDSIVIAPPSEISRLSSSGSSTISNGNTREATLALKDRRNRVPDV